MLFLIIFMLIMYFALKDDSRDIFIKDDLYRKNWHKVSRALLASEIKYAITQTTDKELEQKLNKVLLHRKIRNCLILVWILGSFLKSFWYFPQFIYDFKDFAYRLLH